MNLCDDGHDEVCYEGRQCPVCDALSDAEDEALDLKETINKMQETIDEMASTIEAYEAEKEAT